VKNRIDRRFLHAHRRRSHKELVNVSSSLSTGADGISNFYFGVVIRMSRLDVVAGSNAEFGDKHGRLISDHCPVSLTLSVLRERKS
jgi:hypothetical protein